MKQSLQLALDRQLLFIRLSNATGQPSERIVAAIRAEDERRRSTAEPFDGDAVFWNVLNDLTGLGVVDR